jgi:hypothetical protein
VAKRVVLLRHDERRRAGRCWMVYA